MRGSIYSLFQEIILCVLGHHPVLFVLNLIDLSWKFSKRQFMFLVNQ